MEPKVYRAAGFYLEVKSWENDYDHVETRLIKVESLDEAKTMRHLLNTYGGSHSHDPCSIGNSYGRAEIAKAIEYFNQHETAMTFDEFIEVYGEYAGYGEDCRRVVESVKILELTEPWVYVEH